MFWIVRSQDPELPADFRQHTITDYNSSFINPVFSLDRNNPESIALWSRWQWQGIDGDPTSLLLNYTRRLTYRSAAGVGFFQHNTGLFTFTGGVLNYAYAISLPNNGEISFGANLYAYQRELSDDRFVQDPDMILPLPPENNDFIMQLAPGVQYKSSQFRIGIAFENLLDYNFSESEKVTEGDEKFFLVHTSYDFPVEVFGFTDDTYLRPVIYYKTIPDLDNQIGFNTLLSTPKFWGQAGYNSFYGISVGLGGRFLQKFSLGALMEFATKSEQDGFDPTIELAAAFFIGPQDLKKKEILPIEEEEPEEEEELITEEQKQEEALALEEEKAREAEIARQEATKREAEQARKEREDFVRDSLYAVKLAEVKAARELKKQREKEEARAAKELEEKRKADEARAAKELEEKRKAEEAIAARELEEKRKADEARAAREQFVKDSIAAAELAEAEAQRRKEELAKLAEKEEVKPEEGEKYQEALSEDGLRPGFYLVANVFGTKRYFDGFMKTLTEQGLEPKSFYRNVNKYNYVYLERYDTMTEARRARDSQFNGRYKGDTWIFRVVAN